MKNIVTFAIEAKKYLFAVLLLIGTSVCAWGGLTISQSTIEVTISKAEAEDGKNIATITITGSNLYPYGTPYWSLYDGTNMELSNTGKPYGTTDFTQNVTIYFLADAIGDYTDQIYVYSYDASGNAIVTGNTVDITVHVVSNVTTYQVTFNAGSGNTLVAGTSGISGNGLQTGNITTASMSVLPTATPCATAVTAGWSFDGWHEGVVAANSTSYTNKITTPYVPTSATTLNAVYTMKGSTMTSVTLTQQTGTMPAAGQYIALTQMSNPETAISNTTVTNHLSLKKVPGGDNCSYSNNTLTSTNSNVVYELVDAGTSGGNQYYYLRNIVSGKYLASTDNDKELTFVTSTSDHAKWRFIAASTVFYVMNKSRTGYLYWDSSNSYWECRDKDSQPTQGQWQVQVYSASPSSFTIPTYYQSALDCSVKYHVTYAAGCDMAEITSGSVPVDDTDYDEGNWVDVAENTLTKTGYEFAGWLSSYNENTYDGDGTDGFYMGDADITLTAQWTAATTTITLNMNCAAGTNGSATIKYNASALASKTDATNSATGYHLEGYYTNGATPVKILSSTGAFANSTISGYVTSGKWSYTTASTLTLYAHWELNTHSLHWYKNNEDADDLTGSYTEGDNIAYGTSITAPNTPTFTGHTFEGWSTSSSGSTTTPATSMPDEDVAYYAIWSLNSHKLSVASSIANITVTATPSGESAIAEGGSKESVDYGTSVTLSGTSITSGYTLNHWLVTKDEDGSDVTASCVVGNTLTMPDYDVTVSAMLYGNFKAWCPVITLEWTDGSTPILVTSVGGQSVKAVRTLHLTVTGAPSNASRVEISGDDLEFYDGTTLINNSTNKLTCTDNALDKTITVAYAPSAYVDESWANPTITVECYTAASEGTVAADIKVEDLVNARCLPDNGTGSGQGFVIAAKVDGEWLALPSAMSAGAQDGLPITVDDDENPTEATLAPTSARYNLYNVYKSNGANDRHEDYGDYAYLAGSGSKVLKAASSGTNISLGVNASTYSGGSADAAYFEWLLSTTDKKKYTITNNGRSAQLKYYTTHDKFGMYSYISQVITEFRLLPATFYEEAPMQVVEWKANSVVVMYTGSETTATTKVGNNDPSSSQTLANNKLTHGIYELTTDQALTSNDGAALEISFGDGSTRKIVEVPIIITGNRTATDGHAAQDVVICDGGKLTAAETKYDYYNVYVYGGGKLDIPTGTSLGVNNIILRAGSLSTSGIGSSPSVTYEYIYPQVKLVGTLTSAADSIQYEYITDYDHWYHLCLPFDGKLASIHYPQEYYGDNVAENNKGSWEIDRYAGEIRATGNYNAWVDIESESATSVAAGKGYLYFGAPKKVTVNGDKQRQKWGIQRITMLKSASDAKTAENADKTISGLGSWSSVVGNSGKDNDQGWNLIGNPYMANLTDVSTTNLHACKLEKVLDANDNWTGRWAWNTETSIRYLTIPDAHFDTYTAKTVANAKPLVAGKVFFVQIAGEATGVTFDDADRATLMPTWKVTQEPAVDIETGIVLSNETMEDEVNFWLKEDKTEAYEYNADYPKTPNSTNFNIYGVHEHGDLSWIAVSPEIAEGSMPIGYQVPKAGEFTLSLSETYVSDMIDQVLVTDHAMNPEVTTDLMDGGYNFIVYQAETNNTRFTVSIKLRDESPGTTTDIGHLSGDSDKPTKLIYRDKMYILRGGQIYDATGKQVKEINK